MSRPAGRPPGGDAWGGWCGHAGQAKAGPGQHGTQTHPRHAEHSKYKHKHKRKRKRKHTRMDSSSGTTRTRVIPVSSARISCVLRASLAEKSVGSAMACAQGRAGVVGASGWVQGTEGTGGGGAGGRLWRGRTQGCGTSARACVGGTQARHWQPSGRPTSSNELVCSDCVPPSTAAMACRTRQRGSLEQLVARGHVAQQAPPPLSSREAGRKESSASAPPLWSAQCCCTAPVLSESSRWSAGAGKAASSMAACTRCGRQAPPPGCRPGGQS